MNHPKPFNIGELDQASKHVVDSYIPHIAAVFRAFTDEKDISRKEAMQLTIGFMHIPARPANEGEQS